MEKTLLFGQFSPLSGTSGEALLAENADGLVPVEFFKVGANNMAKGEFRQFDVSPEAASVMVAEANARLAAGERIKINYEHNRTGRKSGEVKAFVRTAEAIVGMAKWTPAARQSIKDSEFEGFSPEFYADQPTDKRGRPIERDGRVLMLPTEIVGGALTNDPAMPDLRIAATKQPPADTTESRKENDHMKTIAARLGLPETASAEEIEKALDALKTKAETPIPPPAISNEQLTQVVGAEVQKAVAAITAKATADAEAKAAAAAAESKFDAVLDAAVKSGKMTAAQREAFMAMGPAKDPAKAEAYVKTLSRIVPMGGAFSPTREAAEAATVTVDASSINDDETRQQLADAVAQLMKADPKLSWNEAFSRVTGAN